MVLKYTQRSNGSLRNIPIYSFKSDFKIYLVKDICMEHLRKNFVETSHTGCRDIPYMCGYNPYMCVGLFHTNVKLIHTAYTCEFVHP